MLFRSIASRHAVPAVCLPVLYLAEEKRHHIGKVAHPLGLVRRVVPGFIAQDQNRIRIRYTLVDLRQPSREFCGLPGRNPIIIITDVEDNRRACDCSGATVLQYRYCSYRLEVSGGRGWLPVWNFDSGAQIRALITSLTARRSPSHEYAGATLLRRWVLGLSQCEDFVPLRSTDPRYKRRNPQAATATSG